MGTISKRIYKTQYFKAGEKCLRALIIATLLAALGALALTPRNALAFVCDSGAAGESGEGATDGGVANNTACGVNANASGAASANAALGSSALASGDNGRNIAIGNQANASGNNGNNTAIGIAAEASGAGGSNIALGNNARALGSNTGNVAIGLTSRAGGGTTLANSSTAVGNASRATLANSAAFGNSATVTRANQQVFGTGVNTYTTPGITSAGSTAAQGAIQGVVTTDANGNLASDGGALQTQANNNATNIGANTTNIGTNSTNVTTNTTDIAALQAATGGTANFRRDIDRNSENIAENSEGVALAMAMGGSYLPLPGERVRISGNLANFKGYNALSFSGAALVSGKNTFLTGSLGVGLNGGNDIGGRVGFSFGW